jgi:putative DNA primase/helicase
VKRVAARFALIAAAGEIATIAGITVWQLGEAISACQKSFKLWLENKGSTSDFERKRLLDQVRGFIELHNGSRFEKFSELNKDVKTKPI